MNKEDICDVVAIITLVQMKKEDIYDFVVTLTIVQVNKDEICVVGEGLKQTSVKYINRDDVLNTMKDNMANSASLKWQYFASEQGVFFSYPTLKYCSDTYDPRFRFVHIQTECSALFFVCLPGIIFGVLLIALCTVGLCHLVYLPKKFTQTQFNFQVFLQ